MELMGIRPTPAPVGAALVLALLLPASGGCVAGEVEAKPLHDTISFLAPRCAELRSCVVGHVTQAGTSAPVAEAAVFLIRELEPGEDEPLRFFALTDHQGVFVVDEPPAGDYRIAVYKDASRVELVGMQLGKPGVTLLPVRLALN